MYDSGSRSYFDFTPPWIKLNLCVHFKRVLPDTACPVLAELDIVCCKSMQLK